VGEHRALRHHLLVEGRDVAVLELDVDVGALLAVGRQLPGEGALEADELAVVHP